ncbi:MAG TPA: flagellin [Bryobacteraceae bacterium]|nr:flagellin [Bryobacteraceae bacterium]
MISIQTNVTSLFAEQNLATNTAFEANTIQQLTSGYRINSSGDDAAGLAVANQFRSSIAELNQGVLNANNGLSSLQIVDGGLNNISTILDRLKTLATESASSTFSGDRNTLNTEYQSLLGEITQQANNIGLAANGKLNVVNGVYIGGGNTVANSQVNIDLSGTQNQVDSNGLGLGTTSVGGGGTALATNTVRLDAPGATFLATAAQTFAFNLYSQNGGAQTVNVSVGGSGALTEQQVIASLNSQLSPYGINASVGSNGQLSFGGSTPFTVTTATTATDLIATATGTATNSGVYSVAGAGSYTTGTAENLTFQNGQGTAHVALGASESVSTAISKINAQTAQYGIYAVANTTGNGISFQSVNNFTASTDQAGKTFTATGAQTTTAPASTGTVTGNAQAAITAINTAIANLGLVQGRVGSGENQLNYAISLATSQITNFSAAQSRIRDADIASEAANLTKAQTLQQTSIAALAQANAAPAAVLKLLQ